MLLGKKPRKSQILKRIIIPPEVLYKYVLLEEKMVLFASVEVAGVKIYLQDAAKLNRLESFILKLVILFVQVANCRRGRYLMV